MSEQTPDLIKAAQAMVDSYADHVERCRACTINWQTLKAALQDRTSGTSQLDNAAGLVAAAPETVETRMTSKVEFAPTTSFCERVRFLWTGVRFCWHSKHGMTLEFKDCKTIFHVSQKP
jgi:hypothetical protein